MEDVVGVEQPRVDTTGEDSTALARQVEPNQSEHRAVINVKRVKRHE